jgi:hypothetical protein
MKAFFFVSAVLVGVDGIGTRADAQNYPWCAYAPVPIAGSPPTTSAWPQ